MFGVHLTILQHHRHSAVEVCSTSSPTWDSWRACTATSIVWCDRCACARTWSISSTTVAGQFVFFFFLREDTFFLVGNPWYVGINITLASSWTGRVTLGAVPSRFQHGSRGKGPGLRVLGAWLARVALLPARWRGDVSSSIFLPGGCHFRMNRYWNGD